jgi:RNA polymerase sigma-70 factor (ECF subfamily)
LLVYRAGKLPFVRDEDGLPRDDDELVRRALRGEIEAYERIVRTYQAMALRTAYVITGSAEDAEEVVQDAFVKAHRALRRFRPGEPLRPWLLTIVGNEARNRRRANASRPPRARGDELEPGGSSPAAESAVLAANERRALGEALAQLSQADRDALACRYFLDLSEAEIASVLGVRRGTVKSRLSRALARLREVVDD